MSSIADTFAMPDCSLCIDKGEMHYLLGKQGDIPKRKAEYKVIWSETSNTLDQIVKHEDLCGPCSEEIARKNGGTRTRIGQFAEEFRGKAKIQPTISRVTLTGYGRVHEGKMIADYMPATEEWWNREEERWIRYINTSQTSHDMSTT